MSESVKISLNDLRFDGDTQARESINWVQVQEYQKMLKDGVVFDPINIIKDAEGNLWVWDGAHRYEAHKKEGLDRILSIVKPGTLDDAIFAAAGANTKHGLARTNADKQRAVDMVLSHTICKEGKWSDRQVANHTNTSHTFVAQRRAALKSPDLAGKKQPVPKQKRQKRDKAPDETALAIIAETDVGQNEDEVKKLAKLPPEEQFDVATKISEGEAKSVDEARAKIFQEKQPQLFEVYTSEEDVVAKYEQIQAKHQKEKGVALLASIQLWRGGSNGSPSIYHSLEINDAMNGNKQLEKVLQDARQFITENLTDTVYK